MLFNPSDNLASLMLPIGVLEGQFIVKILYAPEPTKYEKRSCDQLRPSLHFETKLIFLYS